MWSVTGPVLIRKLIRAKKEVWYQVQTVYCILWDENEVDEWVTQTQDSDPGDHWCCPGSNKKKINFELFDLKLDHFDLKLCEDVFSIKPWWFNFLWVREEPEFEPLSLFSLFTHLSLSVVWTTAATPCMPCRADCLKMLSNTHFETTWQFPSCLKPAAVELLESTSDDHSNYLPCIFKSF